MKYLTWELYKKNAYRVKGLHWKTYKNRWRYHKRAIEIIKRSSTTDPKKVLELGTMGASIVIGSDTMDYDGKWNYYKHNPTYLHDARKLPWPIANKQYEWFVALRVFQHLAPVQRQCFEEALRIADNVLIVVPDKYPKGSGIKLQQFIDWNNGNPPNIVECTPLKSANMHLYWWGTDILKLTNRESLEKKLHTKFPADANLLHFIFLFISKFLKIIKQKNI